MATTPSNPSVSPTAAPAVLPATKAAVAKPVRRAKPVADEAKKPVKKAPVKAAATPAAPAAKSTAKPAAKPVAKAVVNASAKAAAPKAKTSAKAVTAPKASTVVAKQAVQDKQTKTKKPKLVRDSFTMPKAEYLVLDELKQRATKLAYPVKKTELLRAGIKALAAMSDVAYLAAVKVVPVIKTGRPARG